MIQQTKLLLVFMTIEELLITLQRIHSLELLLILHPLYNFN